MQRPPSEGAPLAPNLADYRDFYGEELALTEVESAQNTLMAGKTGTGDAYMERSLRGLLEIRFEAFQRSTQSRAEPYSGP
jgi:hypothetical protein